MTTRPRRTTTLAGPNWLTIGAATGGLVALASAGTALLVLTGTSAVIPSVAAPPPLPSSAPLATAPGVVVLPSLPGSTAAVAAGRTSTHRIVASGARHTPAALLTVFAPPAAANAVVPAAALPVALPFTDPLPAGDPALTGSLVAAPAAVVRTRALLRSEHGSAEATERPAAADVTPGTQAKRRAKAAEPVAHSVNKHANREHANKQPKPKHTKQADRKHAKHAKHAKHDRD